MSQFAHFAAGTIDAIYDRTMEQTVIAGHVVKGRYLAAFTPEQLAALSLVKIEQAEQPAYNPTTEKLERVPCVIGAAEALDTWSVVALTPEQIAEIAARAAEEQRITTLKADAIRQDLVEKLTSASAQQINDFVDANVSNLADTRLMIKRILLVLAVAVKE